MLLSLITLPQYAIWSTSHFRLIVRDAIEHILDLGVSVICRPSIYTPKLILISKNSSVKVEVLHVFRTTPRPIT
jgi:hypothetical protein